MQPDARQDLLQFAALRERAHDSRAHSGAERDLLREDGFLLRVPVSEDCVLCGVCGRRCPVSALRMPQTPAEEMVRGRAGRTRLLHDERRCIACGACLRACRRGALKTGHGFAGRAADWHDLAARPSRLAPGHGLCSGCAAPVVVRQVLSQVEGHCVVALATGCLQVSTTIYPRTAWRTSAIHAGFENAAATVSGAEAAYRALKRRGRMQDDVRFIVFAGDGGTYDIGLQALSGAVERGHSFLYVCYDNGAYMNTGFQRSGATPCGAWTSTTPSGPSGWGNRTGRKPITDIMMGHRMPYVAQASPHDPADLMSKVATALAVDGPSFINVLSPCPRGWRTQDSESIDMARHATETCVWPLFEAFGGRPALTYRPAAKLPVRDWLRRQGRFAHLFEPGREHLLDQLQRQVDDEWSWLLERCREPQERGHQPVHTRGRRTRPTAPVSPQPAMTGVAHERR